ncbi:hypothetical protein [Radiobacillus deserti]|uniref:Uncharacterized protein n=1 Tax=Radiobacillus deserti TaxID=2594883 RepID=A0A516KJ00_9BACI|nr:hypothetical protein [Radiobacillus deserti]QDP41351.1 hypothetical protein FN924_14860 [Radiobacillus deserti]
MTSWWWKWIAVCFIGLATFSIAELLVMAYFDGAPITLHGLAGEWGVIIGILFTAILVLFVVVFFYVFARVNEFLERDIPRDFEKET